MRCKECEAWEPWKDDTNCGYCKMNAPRPEIMPIESGRKYQIIWPSTGKDDWCVEHQAKERVQ